MFIILIPEFLVYIGANLRLLLYGVVSVIHILATFFAFSESSYL